MPKSILTLPALGVLVLLLGGCEPAKKASTVESVRSAKVEGTCREDHANETAQYAGDLTLIRNTATGATYWTGSILNKGDIGEAALAQASAPHNYRAPFVITFDDIAEGDLSGASATLHGVSEHITSGTGSGGPKYKATCDLVVVSR